MVARQLLRFALVGAGNTAISWVVYLALLHAAPAPAAAAAAFAAGAVNGYVWNGRWTFGAAGRPIRYLIVQLGGLGATALATALLAPALGNHVGYAVTTVAVTLAAFWLSRTWAFQPAHRKETSWSTTTETDTRAAA